MIHTDVQVALIGFIGLILSALIAYRIKVSPAAKLAYQVRSVLDGMERSQSAYAVISRMRTATSAERVVLFAAHNSGGIPRPESPFYTTAIYWSVTDDHSDSDIQIGQYKNIVVDAAYIGMLLDAERNGFFCIDTERMETCQLKRYYNAEGVKHSAVFFIAIRDRKFVYISVAKYTDEPFTEDELTRMSLYSASIKELV